MNTTRLLTGGAGTQTSVIAFSGRTPPNTKTAATESYNGSVWTNLPNMSTARDYIGSAGVQTLALGFGGQTATSVVTTTEEWTGEVATANVKTLTTS